MRRAIDNCPSCRSDSIGYDGIKKYSCEKCNWEFYHNTAAAVAGILEYEGKYLCVIRNLDPAKGKLDFPGGFVDPMESAEHALSREIMEELGIELDSLSYLCTAPNIYEYKDVVYSTCDIFYTAKVSDINFNIEESEISGIKWLSADELNPEDFAFMSMKTAIELLKG